jgi:phosphoglycerate dehydrogenase-like enzyme
MEDKINVLVTLKADEALIDRLQAIAPRLNIMHHPAHTATEIPPDVWDEVEVLFTGNVFPDTEMAPRLRWVQVISAGVDRLRDNPLFENQSIKLTTTSGMHAVTMAEYALALMLYFAHGLPQLQDWQASHQWPKNSGAVYEVRMLRGATLGIIGYGSIGRELARLARSFGMEILATKRNAMNPGNGRGDYAEPGTGDPDGAICHRLYPSQALKSMLRECDYVVVLTPRTPETENLLDADAIGAMKTGAVLVNMARGGIVDEAALIAALESGNLRGAAFDVFEEEPLPEDHPLWDAPNLIISPHIAGVMPDYLVRAADIFAENLEHYLNRRELLNIVDWERGY